MFHNIFIEGIFKVSKVVSCNCFGLFWTVLDFHIGLQCIHLGLVTVLATFFKYKISFFNFLVTLVIRQSHLNSDSEKLVSWFTNVRSRLFFTKLCTLIQVQLVKHRPSKARLESARLALVGLSKGSSNSNFCSGIIAFRPMQDEQSTIRKNFADQL